MIKKSKRWPQFFGLELKKTLVTGVIRVSLTTKHGHFSQSLPLDDFCSFIHRSPLTVKKWLRRGCIPDRAIQELITHKILGFFLVPGFDGYHVRDSQLIDSLDREHTAASIEDSGRLRQENRRLYRLLDDATEQEPTALPDNVIPFRRKASG
ncbi:hypothetical protein [Kistimonas asteriae]|uniref:hypothetical protein n=1 Tax=Kistimonas asteriae TaxID=517724 RepID=UPI001BAD6064|nr:hypothetical protein [Kistimonas asteriae]